MISKCGTIFQGDQAFGPERPARRMTLSRSKNQRCRGDVISLQYPPQSRSH
jgi:hypothetical protein